MMLSIVAGVIVFYALFFWWLTIEMKGADYDDEEDRDE